MHQFLEKLCLQTSDNFKVGMNMRNHTSIDKKVVQRVNQTENAFGQMHNISKGNSNPSVENKPTM